MRLGELGLPSARGGSGPDALTGDGGVHWLDVGAVRFATFDARAGTLDHTGFQIV
jgi:hypothetical protein